MHSAKFGSCASRRLATIYCNIINDNHSGKRGDVGGLGRGGGHGAHHDGKIEKMMRFGGSPALCVVAHRIDTPPDPLAGFGVLGILYMQVAAG